MIKFEEIISTDNKDKILSKLDEIKLNKSKFDVFDEKAHKSNIVNNLAYIFANMISEDGTNFNQGYILAANYTINGVEYCTILDYIIAPECREIGFGKALLLNFMKYINEKYPNIRMTVFENISETYVNHYNKIMEDNDFCKVELIDESINNSNNKIDFDNVYCNLASE